MIKLKIAALALSKSQTILINCLITGARGTELPPSLFYLSVYIFIFNEIALFLYYFISFS